MTKAAPARPGRGGGRRADRDSRGSALGAGVAAAPAAATADGAAATDTFVALLRGVNVGAAKRVPMADFRALLAGLGHTNVVTLLNSGNAVFRAPRRTAAERATSRGAGLAGERPARHSAATAEIAAGIAAGLTARLGVEVPVIVKPADALAAVVAENPFTVEAAEHARFLIAFTADADSLKALASLAPRVVPPERFAVGRHAAYLLCPQGILESTAGVALLGKAGRAATTRNWATVLKLHALAAQVGV